jgi:PIN domain nuclease of toxin-antitoxin system
MDGNHSLAPGQTVARISGYHKYGIDRLLIHSQSQSNGVTYRSNDRHLEQRKAN